MIARDQPKCFDDGAVVAVSSRDDGTMLDRTLKNRHHPDVVARREVFTAAFGIDYGECVYQVIHYDDNPTFTEIREVEDLRDREVFADMLYTETVGIGLFLPVADCVATVLYDPVRRAIALAHIGRHASVAKLMSLSIDYFLDKGSAAEDLVIWMAPSVGRDSYRMEYFDYLDDIDWRDFATKRPDGIYLDLVGYNRQLAVNSGVDPGKIHASSIDTATNPNYFSHSQGDTTGRFAVVAQITR